MFVSKKIKNCAILTVLASFISRERLRVIKEGREAVVENICGRPSTSVTIISEGKPLWIIRYVDFCQAIIKLAGVA